MANIYVGNTLPNSFRLLDPVSSTKAILRKELIELLPTEQSEYGPLGSSILRFNVSSNNAFLNGPECFLRFKIDRTDGDEAYDATRDKALALDVGGVMACIRSLEVRGIASGNLIERQDEAHTWYAIQSLVGQSLGEVEQWGPLQADSLQPFQSRDNHSMKARGRTYSTLNLSSAATGVITGGANAFFSRQFNVGDMVTVTGKLPFQVLSITSDTSMTTTSRDVYVAAEFVVHVQDGHSANSHRSVVLKDRGTGYYACVKLPLEILKHHLPLFLNKGGFEFRIELELASRAFITNEEPLKAVLAHVAALPNYKIYEPRFMAMMTVPQNDVLNEFLAQWQTPEGLLFPMVQVRWRRITGAASTSDSIQSNFGVRSGRTLYVVVKDSQISEGNSVGTSLTNASISHFSRSNIDTYQAKIGSHEFPNRPVLCGARPIEAYQHLRNITRKTQNPRLSFTDYASNYNTAIINAAGDDNVPILGDSKHFIMAVDFSRDRGLTGILTGMDTSLVPVDFSVTRSAAHTALGYLGSPVFNMFLEYDAILQMSSAVMTVNS